MLCVGSNPVLALKNYGGLFVSNAGEMYDMETLTMEYAMRLCTLGPEQYMKGSQNQAPFLGP